MWLPQISKSNERRKKKKKYQRTLPLKGDETCVASLENRSWPESLPDMIYPPSRSQLRVWGRWCFLTFPYPPVLSTIVLTDSHHLPLHSSPKTCNRSKSTWLLHSPYNLTMFFLRRDLQKSWQGIVHVLSQLEGPSFPSGAMGWGQVNRFTQPHPSLLKFWREREQDKPGSAQELMSTIATGS